MLSCQPWLLKTAFLEAFKHMTFYLELTIHGSLLIITAVLFSDERH